MLHVEQAPHADHKKLIQVAHKYSDELHALQERQRLILRFLQHPLVELKPGKLPVLSIAQNIFLHKSTSFHLQL